MTPTYQQDIGGLSVPSNGFWPVTPFGAVRFAWAVPDDLETFQSAKIVLIPGAPALGSNLNLFVCPAKNHDSVASAGCFQTLPKSFSGPANQLLEVEIGSLIEAHLGTAGTHYVAVLAYTMPTIATDHLVGLRFTYTPKAPAGVPTLGANTFAGTQTAPAFVGDGSGLTNLPFPIGAATLGANTFVGTQAAPAFVGDGSALTNVAKLGANTFSGPQDLNGQPITNLPSPQSAGDAATKAYVDGKAQLPPMIGGGGHVSSINFNVNFGAMFSDGGGLVQEDDCCLNPMGQDGRLTNFRVSLRSAPGMSESVVLTVRKNQADTSVTCTVTDLATTCTDLVDTVAFTAGDRISIKAVRSSNAAQGPFKWVAVYAAP